MEFKNIELFIRNIISNFSNSYFLSPSENIYIFKSFLKHVL